MALGFDAFGHHLQLEVVREADDGQSDFSLVGIRRDIANESAIDLERIEREALQIGEARIAGPEIIDLDFHADAPQPV